MEPTVRNQCAPGEISVTPEGLRSRNFSLFCAARGVARLGDTMAPVALAAGLVLSGYGAGVVGAVLAGMTACFAGFVIFGGVIADRVNNRVLMIGADLVRVAVQAVMAAVRILLQAAASPRQSLCHSGAMVRAAFSYSVRAVPWPGRRSPASRLVQPAKAHVRPRSV